MGGLIADILAVLRRTRLDALQFELSNQLISDLWSSIPCTRPPPTLGDASIGALIHVHEAFDERGPGRAGHPERAYLSNTGNVMPENLSWRRCRKCRGLKPVQPNRLQPFRFSI
jgi:hypothetical protein